MTKQKSAKARFTIIIGPMLVLLIVSILLGLVWPVLRVQAGPGLPPRGNPPGTSQPGEREDDKDDSPVGAYIELFVQPDRTGLWTVVQWQDNQGNWHNVDGWQGDLGTGGYRRWWVAQKDFNTGPFRWVVSQGAGGPMPGASESFSLPAGAREVVQVVVSLP